MATEKEGVSVAPSVSRPTDPTADAPAATATPADAGALATASLPSATATATSVTAPSTEPASKLFRRATATAALNALLPELTDCRIPKGRSGRVELIFEPDGHVSSAKPLDAYVDTFGGKCVATHLKKARVPPFNGPATTFAYAFVIPDPDR